MIDLLAIYSRIDQSSLDDIKDYHLKNYKKIKSGEIKNSLITMKNTNNEKNNVNTNKTTINLGKCEDALIWAFIYI